MSKLATWFLWDFEVCSICYCVYQKKEGRRERPNTFRGCLDEESFE